MIGIGQIDQSKGINKSMNIDESYVDTSGFQAKSTKCMRQQNTNEKNKLHIKDKK
jgi:hypothetical protein